MTVAKVLHGKMQRKLTNNKTQTLQLRRTVMHVELRPSTGVHVITKEVVTFQHYKVMVGHPSKMECVGILGWKEGSSIALFREMDPLAVKEIQEKVNLILERENEIVEHFHVDTSPLQNESDPDEFNESDFT